MVQNALESTRVLLCAAIGLIVVAGATLDLCFAVLLQRRPGRFVLAHASALRSRPFAWPQAFLVLNVTLLFAFSSLAVSPGAPTPSEASLIAGPLFYALAGLLAASLCLYLARTTIREAFASTRTRTRQALASGVLFGLATIPPVILLSFGLSSATESLGMEPRLQEVFDWLNDESLSALTRGFMMFAAVVIAPVVEETLFRGLLLPILMKGRSFLSAALLSGLYFALVHFHAPSLLPLLALSVAFSAAYAATGSLLTPIVMHALFNLTSLLIFLADKG